ncbi:hypothetical protein [Corynebacterium glutamicum]|uniref:hypothetical protein n=1 Tax=Corynebacterium glutamicum TaxID=1718 RepID=UPI001B8C478E|nr:hypothetical protein [Corynebacterium glutamicum]
MRKVVAVKSFRAGKGAQLIAQGQTVELADDFAEMLISRGIAVDPTADDVADSDDEVEDSDDEVQDFDDEQGDDPDEESAGPGDEVEDSDDEERAGEKHSDYPKLPLKSAPLGEWEEYARKHDISLAGLRNRNEKMAYIRKVVTGE